MGASAHGDAYHDGDKYKSEPTKYQGLCAPCADTCTQARVDAGARAAFEVVAGGKGVQRCRLSESPHGDCRGAIRRLAIGHIFMSLRRSRLGAWIHNCRQH
jgi:hypothetical protein